ncbi:hypothetical protein [Streptomyces sp. NBC_01264]|uniref:hypothetical protein n=1 Tax=Streptomyces sp. NBC_01264 TaxID=2903804 RepID=UPI0022501F95|nr:hypothetical protein [Streptomyces sp. NBC_01264]MCX4782732.1 hypothetical protein [Streptomyces sp. NBC_01264]
MTHQLIEAAPGMPELIWHIVFALVFALLAHQVISVLKAMRHLPRRMAPTLKSALDMTNPLVVFTLHFVATLVALGLYGILESM